MNERGHTLVELLTVVAILLVVAAVAVPFVRAYSVEAHILGAGRAFEAQFMKARSMAITSNEYTAIRFEADGDDYTYSVYRDGNDNGVLATDIARGKDVRIAGPFPLAAGAPGVRVGINPGVPNLPPEKGSLDPAGDPIRFGRSRMVSFSPLGGATPGTFYLAGDGIQGAVRVTGTTGRVRFMVWRGAWRER